MSRQPLFAVALAAWFAGVLPCQTASVCAQQPVTAPPAVPAPPSAAALPAAPAAPPSLEAKERARVAYARGQTAFAAGDYALALQAFEEAFASVPNPIVLLSVSESAAKLGKIDEAVATLDRYVVLRPDAPDRAEVAKKRAALLLLPAHVSVTSEPSGADLVLDGAPTGKKTPVELELSPGDHQLQPVLAGYEAAPSTLHLAPGTHLAQPLVLQALPAPPPPPAALVPAKLAVQTPRAAVAEIPTTTLWVTGTIGAAGLIAGTVLGIVALKEHSDFNSKPSEQGANRGERLALFADVGFGVGAMAALTAAVLYLTHDDVAPKASAAAQRPAVVAGQLQFIPKLSAKGASATALIRF
jgi:tetratricopeptide (TPR) repeat protein